MKKPMLVLSFGLCLVFTLGILTAFNCKNEPKVKKVEQTKDINNDFEGKAAEL